MHTLEKINKTKQNKKQKPINQTNGCGQVSFHFFFGFLRCLFVFVCSSCLSLLYGNSRITINKSQLERRLPRYAKVY